MTQLVRRHRPATSTGAVMFWVLSALAAGRGSGQRQRRVLSDASGDDHDHPAVSSWPRTLLWVSSRWLSTPAVDDAVPVRADADCVDSAESLKTLRGQRVAAVPGPASGSRSDRSSARWRPGGFAGLTVADANGNVEGLAALIFPVTCGRSS